MATLRRNFDGFASPSPGSVDLCEKVEGPCLAEIERGRHQKIGAIVKSANTGVAVAAQKPPNLPGLMIVVDVEMLGAPVVARIVRAAYAATAALVGKKHLIVLGRHSVDDAQISCAFSGLAVRTLVIGPTLLAVSIHLLAPSLALILSVACSALPVSLGALDSIKGKFRQWFFEPAFWTNPCHGNPLVLP